MLLSLILGGAMALGQPPQVPAFRAPSPALPLHATASSPDLIEASADGWRPARSERDADVRLVSARAADDSPEPLNLSVTVPATPKPAAPAAAPAAAPTPRYFLMSEAQGTWLGAALEQSRMTIYGWTEFSYTASTAQGSNLPMGYNDKGGEFLVNQNYLHVERTIDTSKNDCQWGFVSETVMPGSDYRYMVARGLFSGQLTEHNGNAALYGWDPYQMYVQVFLPDLGPKGTKIELGRFASHCGYEVSQAPDTPFMTHTYLFIYNPFTHTGVWAISQLTDAWTVSNGIVTGADTFIDPANRPTYIGQAKWAPPTGRASLTLNTVITDNRYDAKEAFAFYNVYEAILTYKFSDRSSFAADNIYSHIRTAPTGGDTDWFGSALYWTYQVRSNVATIIRAEAFKDTAGFRTGFPGWYTDFTAGINWKPQPWLIVRPSVRYDHNWDSSPFEGKPDLFTTALDVIVRW